MKIILISAALFYLATINAEDVRLLDLEPTDAQQLIDKQDTSLKYAPKIDSNVPAVRYLGNEPHNVLEDIYLANQYHGQDGLGGYLYGYSVPDIAKTERKQAGGDLRGAYNYIAGNGQEIKVEYWDDGTGFHQVDNVPKVLPQQIDDLPEVKAAREEHFRRWQEEAERNSHPVTVPPSHYTPQRAQNQFQPQKYPGFGQSQGSAQGFAQQYSSQQSQGFAQQNPAFGQQSQGFAQQNPAFGQQGQGFAQQGKTQGFSAQGQGFGQQSSGFGQAQGFSQQGHSNAGFGQQGQVKAFGQSQTSPQQYSGATGAQASFQTSGFGQQNPGSGFGQGQIGFAASAPGAATVKAPGSVSGPGYGQQSGSAQLGYQQAQGSAPVPLSHPAPAQNLGHAQQQAQGSSPAGVSSAQHSFQSQQTNPGQGGQGHQLAAAGSFQQTTQVKSPQYGSQGYANQGQGYGSQGQGQQNQGGEDSGEYTGHDDEGQYKPESEEEQGPPRGFFYNFDYPVGIIVQKMGKVGGGAGGVGAGVAGGAGFDPHSQQKRESLQDIYEKNKANFQASLGTGSGAQSGYLAY